MLLLAGASSIISVAASLAAPFACTNKTCQSDSMFTWLFAAIQCGKCNWTVMLSASAFEHDAAEGNPAVSAHSLIEITLRMTEQPVQPLTLPHLHLSQGSTSLLDTSLTEV